MKHPLSEALKRKRHGLTIEISMGKGHEGEEDKATDLAPEGSPEHEGKEEMMETPSEEAKMHSASFLKQAVADKALAGNEIPVEGEDAILDKEKVFGMKPDGRKPTTLKERMLAAVHKRK